MLNDPNLEELKAISDDAYLIAQEAGVVSAKATRVAHDAAYGAEIKSAMAYRAYKKAFAAYNAEAWKKRGG